MQNILLEKLSPIEGLRITGPEDIEKRLPGHISVAISGAEGEVACNEMRPQGNQRLERICLP